MIGVDSGFIRVDWEVDWGAVDMMLSSIAPEVTRISQHFQKVLWDITMCVTLDES